MDVKMALQVFYLQGSMLDQCTVKPTLIMHPFCACAVNWDQQQLLKLRSLSLMLSLFLGIRKTITSFSAKENKVCRKDYRK